MSDRGSKFTSKFWREFSKSFSIEQKLSTAFHPETDGQTERVNSSLKAYLRAYVAYDQSNWAEHLPLAEFAYNNAPHSSTGVSPFFANKGQHPTLDIQITATTGKQLGVKFQKLRDLHKHVQAKVAKAQTAYKKFADKRRQPAPPYKVGDKVFLTMKNIQTTRPTAKLADKRTGPYKIVKVVNKNAVRIELPDSFGPTYPTFNVLLLEPAPRNTILGCRQPPPDPVQVDGQSKWEIVKLLESKYIRNKLHYRFLWLGYKDDNSERMRWHPAINAEHAPDLVAAFHTNNPKADGPAPYRPGPRPPPPPKPRSARALQRSSQRN